MKLNAHWPSILESARLGDLDPAHLGRQADPEGALADYFYGRCLTEAGEHLDEAIPFLQRAAAAEPGNPLIVQTLALALARSGFVTNRVTAAEIWNKEGLPLDLDLLGQVSLTLEAQTRSWPSEVAAMDLPWPVGLPEPGPDLAAALSPAEGGDLSVQDLPSSAATPARDNLTQPAVTKKRGVTERWHLNRTISQMEGDLMAHQPLKVLQTATAMLALGTESPELHLVAGLAADEAGLERRARAHLSRADRLEPGMFLARTWLGRIYWRNGWFDLALALWRSVPVEGPYDYGRHYHLALGHDALGNRAAAFEAMRVALDRFYFDTRHFHVKRALWAWQARWAPELIHPAA